MADDQNKWREKLVNLLQNSDLSSEFEINRLYSLVHPPSLFALSEELANLTTEGKLDVFYRIVSPRTGQGLGDYRDILLIPSDLYDESSDSKIKVHLSRDVELLYKRSKTKT